MAKKSRTKYRIQATATTKTYFYCWAASKRALKAATENELGSFYFCMMAGTFAAFAVEGFLNHVGQKEFPDWSSTERKRTPREKLKLLKTELNLNVDMSRRPFRTLDDMWSLRDALAHGKTKSEYSNRIVYDPEDPSANWPEPRWKQLCGMATVSQMVDDAEAIVRDLNEQIGYRSDPFVSPGHAWSGAELV